MPKVVYCSECGQKIELFRRAIPSHLTIIDLINPHKCSPEPQKLDLSRPSVAVTKSTKATGKFITQIDELTPSRNPVVSKDPGLRDRRFDKTPQTSSAPQAIIDKVKSGEGESSDKGELDKLFEGLEE